MTSDRAEREKKRKEELQARLRVIAREQESKGLELDRLGRANSERERRAELNHQLYALATEVDDILSELKWLT